MTLDSLSLPPEVCSSECLCIHTLLHEIITQINVQATDDNVKYDKHALPVENHFG